MRGHLARANSVWSTRIIVAVGEGRGGDGAVYEVTAARAVLRPVSLRLPLLPLLLLRISCGYVLLVWLLLKLLTTAAHY